MHSLLLKGHPARLLLVGLLRSHVLSSPHLTTTPRGFPPATIARLNHGSNVATRSLNNVKSGLSSISRASEAIKSLMSLNALSLNTFSLNSLPEKIKKEIPLLIEFEVLFSKLVPLSVFPDVPSGKILLGLYYLWQEKKTEQLLHRQALNQMLMNGGTIPPGFAPRYPNVDVSKLVQDHKQIQQWLYLGDIANCIYAAGAPKGMSRKTMLKKEKIVEGLWHPVFANNTWKPAHFVAVDDYSKTIMLVVRGTKAFSDITTDIGVRIRPFHEPTSSSVHSGMGDAAELLALEHKALLQRLIHENPGYDVQCVGHSLGGAVAALTAIILKREIPEIRATSFAAPPSVSGETAEGCKEYVNSLVLRDDLFFRTSLGSLTRLLLELRDHEWSGEIMQDLKNDLGDFLLGLKKNAILSRALEETKFVDKVSSWLSLETPATEEEGVKRRSGRLKKDLDKAYTDFVLDSKEHVELYNPGRIFHIVERDELGLPQDGTLDQGGPIQDHYCVVESAKEHFRTIVLTETMIQDHKLDNYVFALREALKRLD